jgi:2-polyprenyl-6-methoxyphenol hydroxylase-like FAD-dependent oxidoreductase
MAAQATTTTKDYDYDVAIVGGGPAGLLTAHALAAASRGAARVAVFERVPALAPRGAGLGLMANGLEAIAAISEPLFDAIMTRGESGGRARMHAIGGAVQGEVDLNAAPEAGAMTANGRRGRVFWAWSDLQSLFADTLPRDGGNGGGCVDLNLGEKLEAIEEVDNGSGVALRFANRDAPVTAAVAVGADGYFSKVRALTIADGPPQDMQTVFWRARIPESDVRAAGVDPGGDGLTQQFMGDGLVFLLMPVTSGDYTWAGSCPVSLLREAGVEWPPPAAAAAVAKGGEKEDATKLSVLGSASAMDAEERRCARIWGRVCICLFLICIVLSSYLMRADTKHPNLRAQI